jgi:sigma-B regulation protein RsbU (phosphoserine phosphatase)
MADGMRLIRGMGAQRKAHIDTWTTEAIESNNFVRYQNGILHDWLRTLTALALALVPLFFILDMFMMPAALLPRFGIYRLFSSLWVLAQFIIVRKTSPSRWSYLHGYLMSAQVGGIIASMTIDIGGFNSSYYAGLNLVVIGVNLLMPWKAKHTIVNCLLILAMYVGVNLIFPHPYDPSILTNNIFFLISTASVAAAINMVRHRLMVNEFNLLVELKDARDAVWGEMELAKRIQTALLPQKDACLPGYACAAVMLPAREVGGDYYDIIKTDTGGRWVAIGDVAGHGVDSGLIMMMAQTSVLTSIRSCPTIEPLEVLKSANRVLREDIARLGSNHYMTMLIMQLKDDRIVFAGHHQDLLIYRSAQSKVSVVNSRGTWLGITDNIDSFMSVDSVDICDNDIILLFSDGVTEAANESGEMYGQERLQEALQKYADDPVDKALDHILEEVRAFQSDQADDITLVLMKKRPKMAAA